MMVRFPPLTTLIGLMLAASAHADVSTQAMEWTIDGEMRRALVVAPSKPSDAGVPVILVFHGHGGTMRSMERKGFQTHWPDAVVVCPQGLPTATVRDPEGKRSGWQPRLGDNGDRDVKFVDAILRTVRAKFIVDDQRIYATGHSNGGGFTYLLWGARGSELAAIAPVAAGIGLLRRVDALTPLPVLHLAGETDQVVPFANQKRTMDLVRKRNGCDPDGESWAKLGTLIGTRFPSKGGTPVIEVIHPGGHLYPNEAPALIVKFFKEHVKPPGRGLK